MPNPFHVQATNSGGGSGEVPPAGNHPSILIGLIDLGTHEDEYQGRRIENRKAFFCWELTAEHRTDGSPFVLGSEYNVQPKLSGKSKLRIMLEGWRGKPLLEQESLELEKLLGRSCLLNIGHATSSGGSIYAKILGISPPPKGLTVPPAHHRPYFWYFDSGEPLRVPEWVPWLFGKSVEDWIAEARENRVAPAAVGAGAPTNNTASTDEDEPPF
jgi:hypothetical protein